LRLNLDLPNQPNADFSGEDKPQQAHAHPLAGGTGTSAESLRMERVIDSKEPGNSGYWARPALAIVNSLV
jgi:hypothetical protein